MSSKKTLQQLKEKYAGIINNVNIKKVAEWTEPNTDMPTDEEKFKNEAIKSLPSYIKKMDQVLKTIKA